IRMWRYGDHPDRRRGRLRPAIGTQLRPVDAIGNHDRVHAILLLHNPAHPTPNDYLHHIEAIDSLDPRSLVMEHLISPDIVYLHALAVRPAGNGLHGRPP